MVNEKRVRNDDTEKEEKEEKEEEEGANNNGCDDGMAFIPIGARTKVANEKVSLQGALATTHRSSQYVNRRSPKLT